MGIKLMAFVRRPPDLDPEAFHRLWREEHAERIARTPELRRYLRRLELNHRLDADRVRERHPLEVPGTDIDGVAVQWFESLEAYRAMTGDPACRDPAGAEQGRFREERVAWLLTAEPEIIVERPGREGAGAKLLCIFRRHPDMDKPTFHQHWLHHHGGLFRDIPELNAPLLGYHQNHGLDLPGVEYDGVTEQWFDSLDAFVAALDARAHHEVVEPDVARMLDPASIQFIVAGRPTVVIDG